MGVDDWEMLGVVALCILAVCVTIVILVGVASVPEYAYERYVQCPAFGHATGRPVKYDWWSVGCLVQTQDGRWIEAANYGRGFN
jgi:hypothetical protein